VRLYTSDHLLTGEEKGCSDAIVTASTRVVVTTEGGGLAGDWHLQMLEVLHPGEGRQPGCLWKLYNAHVVMLFFRHYCRRWCFWCVLYTSDHLLTGGAKKLPWCHCDCQHGVRPAHVVGADAGGAAPG
jgi:hypothetical protein